MKDESTPKNNAKNNLLGRLYKSHNKKLSSSHKPLNLPHL